MLTTDECAHIKENGTETYKFEYPEAEIKRDIIQKTIKFSGEDAYLYCENFETFLNCHINSKFIMRRYISIYKRAVKPLTPTVKIYPLLS